MRFPWLRQCVKETILIQLNLPIIKLVFLSVFVVLQHLLYQINESLRGLLHVFPHWLSEFVSAEFRYKFIQFYRDRLTDWGGTKPWPSNFCGFFTTSVFKPVPWGRSPKDRLHWSISINQYLSTCFREPTLLRLSFTFVRKKVSIRLW